MDQLATTMGELYVCKMELEKVSSHPVLAPRHRHCSLPWRGYPRT